MSRPQWGPEGIRWQPYAAAVAAAGGEPVHLGPETQGREAEVLASLQGVLFSGGRDIDLALYPNPPALPPEEFAAWMEHHRMELERERDAYELPLLQEALERDVPLLGICRGCQVLQVGMGGQLYLDIPIQLETPIEHRAAPEPDNRSSRHALRILPGSLLAEVLPPDRFTVCNSRHHQSARPEPVAGVRVSAVCPEDGVIEAIEVPDRRWVIGVQWHPEHARDTDIRELYAPLFSAFVLASS